MLLFWAFGEQARNIRQDRIFMALFPSTNRAAGSLTDDLKWAWMWFTSTPPHTIAHLPSTLHPRNLDEDTFHPQLQSTWRDHLNKLYLEFIKYVCNSHKKLFNFVFMGFFPKSSFRYGSPDNLWIVTGSMPHAHSHLNSNPHWEHAERSGLSSYGSPKS